MYSGQAAVATTALKEQYKARSLHCRGSYNIPQQPITLGQPTSEAELWSRSPVLWEITVKYMWESKEWGQTLLRGVFSPPFLGSVPTRLHSKLKYLSGAVALLCTYLREYTVFYELHTDVMKIVCWWLIRNFLISSLFFFYSSCTPAPHLFIKCMHVVEFSGSCFDFYLKRRFSISYRTPSIFEQSCSNLNMFSFNV